MATTKTSKAATAKAEAILNDSDEPKQPEEPQQPESRDIDSRMDALLQDHIRMGARPPEES
jgi:hypothetical protein